MAGWRRFDDEGLALSSRLRAGSDGVKACRDPRPRLRGPDELRLGRGVAQLRAALGHRSKPGSSSLARRLGGQPASTDTPRGEQVRLRVLASRTAHGTVDDVSRHKPEEDAVTLPPPAVQCVFFRTAAGGEPVREWLKGDIPEGARKKIGKDLWSAQTRWPVGKPLVDYLGGGLWELRTTHNDIEYRVIFLANAGSLVLLHGFVKKGQKTRKAELDIARERKSLTEKP